MTKLRGFIPTTLMLITLMFGATVANAGIIVTNRATTGSDPCSETSKDFAGIIVTNLKTVAKFARTGIIVTNAADTQDTCGIIVTN